MSSSNNHGPSLIVAGFEPFAGRRRNQSWEVVRRLVRKGVQTAQLPVDFARLRAAVAQLVSRRPRALLLVGESPARRICVEQIAVNVADSDRSDNAGAKPQMEPLVPGAPLALAAPWNAREVARGLKGEGIPAVASFHAGTFACNAALYLALLECAGETAVGFLHVPRRPWPVGVPRRLLLRAIDACLDALKGARERPLAFEEPAPVRAPAGR